MAKTELTKEDIEFQNHWDDCSDLIDEISERLGVERMSLDELYIQERSNMTSEEVLKCKNLLKINL